MCFFFYCIIRRWSETLKLWLGVTLSAEGQLLHCQVYSCKWRCSVDGGKKYISPRQFSMISLWMTPTWFSKDRKSVVTATNWYLSALCAHYITSSRFILGGRISLFSRVKLGLGQFKLLGLWFHRFCLHSALATKKKNQSSYKGTCCWTLSLLHPLSGCLKGINEAKITSWCCSCSRAFFSCLTPLNKDR